MTAPGVGPAKKALAFAKWVSAGRCVKCPCVVDPREIDNARPSKGKLSQVQSSYAKPHDQRRFYGFLHAKACSNACTSRVDLVVSVVRLRCTSGHPAEMYVESIFSTFQLFVHNVANLISLSYGREILERKGFRGPNNCSCSGAIFVGNAFHSGLMKRMMSCKHRPVLPVTNPSATIANGGRSFCDSKSGLRDKS
eukprot:1181270-Prorocentrum_minimum.AAC.3